MVISGRRFGKRNRRKPGDRQSCAPAAGKRPRLCNVWRGCSLDCVYHKLEPLFRGSNVVASSATHPRSKLLPNRLRILSFAKVNAFPNTTFDILHGRSNKNREGGQTNQRQRRQAPRTEPQSPQRGFLPRKRARFPFLQRRKKGRKEKKKRRQTTAETQARQTKLASTLAPLKGRKTRLPSGAAASSSRSLRSRCCTTRPLVEFRTLLCSTT
jgi:hypothetical protein